MIDLHSHVLPGLDDGATSLSESVEMARAAAADGIRCLAATPHVRHDYPTRPDEMEARVAELQDALDRDDVPVRILTGGELALEELDRLSLDEVRRFGLGGNPRYVLIEFPYTGWPLGLDRRVFALRTQGIFPVLAHPERNRDVQRDPSRLEALVQMGSLVQVTAASLDGRLGRSSAACARTLLDGGLAHLLASDAHAPGVRAIGLSAAARAVGDDGLARWLTLDVPRAIVENRPLPTRPEPERRRLLARLRRL